MVKYSFLTVAEKCPFNIFRFFPTKPAGTDESVSNAKLEDFAAVFSRSHI